MGVILFKLIAKHHPYVIDVHDNRIFIKQLALNKIKMPKDFKIKYSFKFQYLLSLIIRMIAKK